MPALSPAIPAPATPRRARRKQARPGELLEAALALFAEKGYAATRVDAVAARAGVSKGTLFLYFPSKEALFQAVVHEYATRHLDSGLREVAAYAGPSAELLREFLRRWWVRWGSTPASSLTKLIIGEAANFPDLAAFYQQEVVRPGHALVRAIVQRGIARGEFRPVDLDSAVHLVVAPLLHLCTWRHALAGSAHASELPDAPALLALHADWVVRALQPEGAAP